MGAEGAGWVLLSFLVWQVQTKLSGDLRAEAEGEGAALPDGGPWKLSSCVSGDVWTDASWLVLTSPPPV